MEQVAADLGGRMLPPQLSWKYSWIKAAFGWEMAKSVSQESRKMRWSVEKSLDKAMFRIKSRNGRLTYPDT